MHVTKQATKEEFDLLKAIPRHLRPEIQIPWDGKFYTYAYVHGQPCSNLTKLYSAAQGLWGKPGDPKLPLDPHAYYGYISHVVDGYDNDVLTYIADYQDYTPVYYCHGDMTHYNTIYTKDERVLFIDPGFSRGLPCREIDEAKIMQSWDGFFEISDHLPRTTRLPFIPKKIHFALLITHYWRLMRHFDGYPHQWAEQRADMWRRICFED